MTRRKRGTLSEDDLAIWRQVAQTAKPLGKPAGPLPAPPPKLPAPHRAPAPIAPFRVGEGHRNGHKRDDLVPSLERQIAAHPVRMDKKTFGRMKRGKLKPERKLDLHGMTLDRAHSVLNGFIRNAHADGLRLVIVVTGKGKSGKDEGGPIPTPKGVLRHHVPGWLHAPPLRLFVLQVTDAHVRHGGGGAYYVYLTRGRAASGPRG